MGLAEVRGKQIPSRSWYAVIFPSRHRTERRDKPDYASLLTFGGAPYPEEPEGADIVIVGAPIDELVSDRPGTRFAPRAIRSQLVGADPVEVIPTLVGSADVTALAAERVVRETLGGIALHRRSR